MSRPPFSAWHGHFRSGQTTAAALEATAAFLLCGSLFLLLVVCGAQTNWLGGSSDVAHEQTGFLPRMTGW